MDLTGFDAYLAYSLREAIVQAESNENPTRMGQPEEQDKEEIEKEA